MNSQPIAELDSFETALLAELKKSIAAPAAAPATRPQLPAGRRRWYVTAAMAVIAAIIAAAVVGVLRPTPAFAVSGRTNGKVTVHVMRLEGAGSLERALAKRGIRADISYLPPGKECAPGRFVDVSPPGLLLSVGADDFTVTIPAGSVGKDNAFVMSAAVVPIQHGVSADVEFGIAKGPVAPCRVIPAKTR